MECTDDNCEKESSKSDNEQDGKIAPISESPFYLPASFSRLKSNFYYQVTFWGKLRVKRYCPPPEFCFFS